MDKLQDPLFYADRFPVEKENFKHPERTHGNKHSQMKFHRFINMETIWISGPADTEGYELRRKKTTNTVGASLKR